MLTDQQHPITPPPELLQQWATEYWGNPGESIGEGEKYIATQAARWGADRQLNADCEWLRRKCLIFVTQELRAAMRPKPPSLKEQALTQLDSLHADLKAHGLGTNTDTIRRALERLQELEEGNE